MKPQLRLFAVAFAVILPLGGTAKADLNGTTMQLIVDHTGMFGRPVGGTYEYGTLQTFFDSFNFSWDASSPAGQPGFDNSILIDFNAFAYADFANETATVSIATLAEDVMKGSVTFFNADGLEIGFNLSGSGDALGGQFPVNDVLNASDLTVVIAWNSVLGGECPWDLDGGGGVGILDLLALLAAWGPNPGHPADFDGSGDVGILDLLTLLANWGPCP
ncbi:MAG: hypothetical protein O6758_01645 [Planctomycetota bacterium]|nr:hypothetical protein [Planctomycetota bacterium]